MMDQFMVTIWTEHLEHRRMKATSLRGGGVLHEDNDE